MISLISLVKSCPRFASSAPFFRLIVAHLEWPLIRLISVEIRRATRTRQPEKTRESYRLGPGKQPDPAEPDVR